MCIRDSVYLPKEGTVILGDHVTLESGSGCVHTAGGHGVDDFNVSQKYNVPITVPCLLYTSSGQSAPCRAP